MVQGEVREVTADLTFAETTRYQVIENNIYSNYKIAIYRNIDAEDDFV